MLHLKSIKKSYTTGDFTQVALNGIDLSFRDQEFVAILGHSGSGKTTSLNIIGGLDQYDSGDLIINGRSTKDFNDRDWDAYRNNSVGFVFQSYNLIPHLSILNNVEMGMTLSGVSAADKRAKALSTLEKVGLKDHINKKPTQLSGGQMQRVAIARALANDPDIILADEPTGALDTTTSGQIMDLIKEIAEDKLVIMVTHNPELAKKYADRIVEFKDGEVISDSNPYTGNITQGSYSFKRTSMSFFTALKLSGKNIATKKWRTALTAFASSIGIIGIALIMSLSNGLQAHIDNFQEDSLAEFPIMIIRDAFDMSEETIGDMQDRAEALDAQRFTEAQHIYLFEPDLSNIFHTNIFTDEFLTHMQSVDPEIVSSIGYLRFIGMNLLREVDGNVVPVNLESGAVGMMGAMMDMGGMDAGGAGLPSFPETLGEDNESHLARNYTLLAGSYPEDATDVVIIVDEFNRINLSVLTSLGFDTSDLETITFEEVVGTEIRLIPNNVFYLETEFGNFMPNMDLDAVYASDEAITLTISGVFRINEDVAIPLMSPGVVYSDALTQSVIDREMTSDIVVAQRDSDVNVMTLEPITEEERAGMLTFLGGNAEPFAMLIFPRSFEAQDELIAHINYYNDHLIADDEYRIVYMNQAEFIVGMTGGLLSAVTNVLIGFAAISLVVSLIMIAIITYISVMERTKEIGILRALGARKKDITRVFNAETFIIGMCSGALAITVSYLLTIPINTVIYTITELQNVSVLDPLQALGLLTLSLVLTLLGGFIPARLAAKKDPVAALRAE
ncbi:MAG: ABC transporter ATP-binding protein/permease [Turicibacter sp.]|nr:ABC transporter ATP-binding protein/permease [Turicibacter sp.]